MGVFGHASVPLPGGCDIGVRPIDQTLRPCDPGRSIRWAATSFPPMAFPPSVGATVNNAHRRQRQRHPHPDAAMSRYRDLLTVARG